MFENIASGLLGFLLGLAFQRFWKWTEPARALVLGPDRPARLVPNTKFEATTPGLILEPAHRYSMWKTYMRAFIFHGEMCKRLMSFREMETRIGISSRQQRYYRKALLEGGVIRVVRSGGVYWQMGWQERRDAIQSLPYPRQFDPPIFPPRKPSRLKQRVTVQRSASQRHS